MFYKNLANPSNMKLKLAVSEVSLAKRCLSLFAWRLAPQIGYLLHLTGIHDDSFEFLFSIFTFLRSFDNVVKTRSVQVIVKTVVCMPDQ